MIDKDSGLANAFLINSFIYLFLTCVFDFRSVGREALHSATLDW